jgi:hypothetical protein
MARPVPWVASVAVEDGEAMSDGRRTTPGETLAVNTRVQYPILVELALALPWGIAGAAHTLRQRVAARRRTMIIAVPRLSDRWLVEYNVEDGKHCDQF